MAVLPGSSGQVPESGNDPSLGGVKWMENVTEQGVKNRAYDQVFPSMQGAKNSLFGNFIGGIFSGFLSIFQGGSGPSWLPSTVSTAAEHIRDGMTDLAGRTDLLEGVRGFCMAYQSLNVNAQWNLGTNTREMPFNAQYGPSKGAEISGNGIRLNEAGAWRIDAMVRAQGTSFTGSDGALMDLIVYKPNGSVHLRRRYDAWPGTGVESIYGGSPIVVDTPGYYIRVETWTGRWRWWTGGTLYTFLSAVKYDNRPINPGQETVPNETQ